MEKVRKNILNILKESEENQEKAGGLTIAQYAKFVYGGEMDCDVCDKDIDMLVAMVYDVNHESSDEMSKFLDILANNVKIVKAHPSSYGDVLECDFSSFFKPYNEQLKEFFDMSRSEFDDDEAYYEAVVNLEPLISGNASEQTYKELNNILTNKQSKPEVSQNDSGDNMNESTQKMSYDEFLNSKWLKDYLKIEFKTSGYNEWSEFINNFEKDNVKSARDDNLKDYYKDYLRESANLDKTENSLSIDYDLIKYMMSEYEYYSKFPEYNDVVEEYYGSLTKEEYNKAIEIANKIKDIPTYNGALELSDNHTLYELKSLDDAYDSYSEDVYYTYNQFVEDAVRTFEEDTGVKLYGEGRSGRHIVVDDTIENRIKYDELKEKQAELEKWVINNTNRYIDAINSGKDTSEAYDYAIGVNELITESADLTAEATYHDGDGTRDYVAGKLSDGRYFLIGQQEQILVSDKDLPSLAKKDMDDFRYDEDGDKEFIEALENGTTLDKNSDLAKVIINASRKYLDDGCYLLSESTNIDVNNLTKEQLWKLRQEIVLGSLYTHDYDNSFGIDPSAVYNFFDSFIEDSQVDDYGRPNNRKTEEYDNAEDLYNYYKSCENPFGEVYNMNEDAAIDNNPDLDADQVQADADYWNGRITESDNYEELVNKIDSIIREKYYINDFSYDIEDNIYMYYDDIPEKYYENAEFKSEIEKIVSSIVKSEFTVDFSYSEYEREPMYNLNITINME